MTWISDISWWVPVGVIVVGLGVLWSARRRTDRWIRRGAAAAIVLGAVLGACIWFIPTDLKRAQAQSIALVDDVGKSDWTAVATLLNPNADLVIQPAGHDFGYHSRDELLGGAKKQTARIGLKSVKATVTAARQKGDVLTVSLRIVSVQDYTLGYPYTTEWEFDWRRENGSLQAVELRCVRLDSGGDGNQVPK